LLPFGAHSNVRLFFCRDCLAMFSGSARLFAGLCLATLLFRSWFAWTLPITGDEAYFYYWGVNPALGFYDHPPMVGWWLYALSQFSHQPFVLRLPSLLLPLVLAGVAWRLLSDYGRECAWFAACLVLLVPLNAWNVAITTDIPLIFFAALTLWFYVLAQRSGRPWYYALCGLALGGALLSKYFAALLALALAAHMVLRGGRRPWFGLFLVIAFSLPAALVQIYWNSLNCWPNLMFNLVNRHENSGWSWRTPLLYLATVAYVVSPLVLFWLIKPRPATKYNPDQSIYAWVSLFGFGAFLLLSSVKTIGLHWVAIFVLPALLWFACRADSAQRRLTLGFSAIFAVLHYLLIGAALLLPIEQFSSWRGYPGLVMTLAPDSLARALAPFRSHEGRPLRLASDGYSAAVTMGFNLREYMLVFGPGSSHARHDDILTDLRALQGGDLLIVRREAESKIDDRRFFERVATHKIDVRGANFYLTQGFGFKYEPYRDEVLEQVRQRYYAVPRWLPPGACYFCDRYFPDRACHQ
jgi:Dolichyl-phosphate-mannose-protein mannosyltransferase